MRRLALRFPRWARVVFSGSFLLSLTTGLLWFTLDRWGEIQGKSGPEKHPWLTFIPKVHGAGAFIALVSIGMITAGHIPAGWRAHRSRKSGIFILCCVATIIGSAWGLYYAGGDQLRAKLVLLHLSAGCLLPVTILIHLCPGSGHYRRPRAKI